MDKKNVLMEPKKLNLGCGNDIKEGWINLDKIKLKDVDVVYDLNKLPLPFKDSSIDYILCNNILEHIDDYISLLKDCHRILKKDGEIEIILPHFTSVDSYSDPTHKHLFSSQTFLYFLSYHNLNYYFDFSFKEVKTKIKFLKKIYLFFNYILEPLVNINDRTRLLYEATCLNIFPAFRLIIKVKK